MKTGPRKERRAGGAPAVIDCGNDTTYGKDSRQIVTDARICLITTNFSWRRAIGRRKLSSSPQANVCHECPKGRSCPRVSTDGRFNESSDLAEDHENTVFGTPDPLPSQQAEEIKECDVLTRIFIVGGTAESSSNPGVRRVRTFGINPIRHGRSRNPAQERQSVSAQAGPIRPLI